MKYPKDPLLKVDTAFDIASELRYCSEESLKPMALRLLKLSKCYPAC